MGQSSWNGYERNCLFSNLGGAEFEDVARGAGADCVKDSRGVAIADLNADGLLDLVINNNNAKPVIYFNQWKTKGNWLQIKLIGSSSNRDAIGATVRVTITDGSDNKTLTRQVEAGSGYASQRMLPVHFGLGDAQGAQRIEINWPSGLVQRFGTRQIEAAGGINQPVTVREGGDLQSAGRPVSD